MLLVDLFRRAGEIEEAKNIIESRFERIDDKHVLNFQRILLERNDTGNHKIGDALQDASVEDIPFPTDEDFYEAYHS